MRIESFIWLDEIVDQLERKHQVVPEEVVQVFKSKPHIRFISKGRQKRDEDVYAAYGQSAADRYLTIFFRHPSCSVGIGKSPPSFPLDLAIQREQVKDALSQ